MGSNYGIALERSTSLSGTYASVGSILDLELPEVSTEKINRTNQASGGKTQFVPSGLIDMSDFNVTLEMTQEASEAVYDDMTAKTIAYYKVTYPSDLSITPWVFQAFPIKIAPQNADAQSPDLMKVVVTFTPTGGLISGL